jgi:ABC-type branched-subunit amino acid transport system ATPase component
MKEFLTDMFNQIFGFQKPRTGKIIITRYAYQKMREYQLDDKTLEDTFRHGEEVKEGKIIRKYANYSVGIYYKLEETQFHKNIKPEE